MSKRSLFLLTVLLNFLIVSAQTDTITYTECEIDTTPNQYDKLLRYFVAEKEDVNHLWKFNAVDWATLNPSIAFEQRIFKPITVEFEAKIETKSTYEDEFLSYTSINFFKTFVTVKGTLNAEFRCYHSKYIRERKGKSTSGFTGNYFFVGGGVNLNNTPHIETGGTNLSSYRTTEMGAVISTGYGYQKRLGSIAYMDIRGGFRGAYVKQPNGSYQTHIEGFYPLPFIDVNFGIALNSLKLPYLKRLFD